MSATATLQKSCQETTSKISVRCSSLPKGESFSIKHSSGLFTVTTHTQNLIRQDTPNLRNKKTQELSQSLKLWKTSYITCTYQSLWTLGLVRFPNCSRTFFFFPYSPVTLYQEVIFIFFYMKGRLMPQSTVFRQYFSFLLKNNAEIPLLIET